jgi:xylulokinase
MLADREQTVLAIDLGTSGPKVALVSSTGDVLDYEFEPTPLYLLPGGGAEQNPDEWWEAIRQAASRLLARRAVPPGQVAALGCTTQWSGTVAVDRAGRPLMNAIIWMDMRGAPYLRQVVGGPLQIEGYGIARLLSWIRLTGGVPSQSGKDPIAHILFLKKERPEVYRQAYKFLEPKDYLNLRLTGLFAASYDSICLHWLTDNRDINQVVYSDRLLALTGIEREKLPDLQPAAAVLGPLLPQAAAELGLPAGIPVAIGTPDIQSAAIGSGAVQDFAAHIYIGTSSWLACHVPFKKTDPLHNLASIPAGIPGRYLVTNEQESAGACLNYLKDELLYPQDVLATGGQPDDVYERLNRAAASAPPGSGRLIFTPWLYGERSPVDDASVRGGFHNQSLRTTRAHLVRAVFEGVAYNTRWLLSYVEKFVRRRLDPLLIAGGGAVSDLWCQIYADVLDRTIRQVQEPRLANARGAGFLACTAIGSMAFADISQRIRIARTYQPDPANRQIYDALFAEFVNLYRQNRGIYARLNRAQAR